MKIVKYTNEKQTLIKSDTVVSGLLDSERIMINAGTGKPISNISDVDLSKYVQVLVKNIIREVGIREYPDAYIIKRFTEILKRYYGNLTLKDVRLAFEMANVGELDEYLPHGRYGDADNNHYQSFSLDYVSKILNAYKRRLSAVVVKARKLLPEKAESPTEAEKIAIRGEFLRSLYDLFDEYKETGVLKPVIKFILLGELKSAGFDISGEVTEAAKRKAVGMVKNGNFSAIVKSKIISGDGEILNDYENRALEEIEIRKCFDMIISKGKHLKDFVK